MTPAGDGGYRGLALDTSNVHYIEMAKMMEAVGVQTIIYTDISKDGMLSGVSGEQLDAINQAVECNIIASGGVKHWQILGCANSSICTVSSAANLSIAAV